MKGPALALLLASSAAAQELPVIVHLGDGSSLPLNSWTLSYEYLAWPQGTTQEQATASRREARELWVGKRRLPASALTMEIVYKKAAPTVERLSLKPALGRPSAMKAEAPHRELLAPTADGKTTIVPRSLDIRGTTMTGTRRELCLVPYSVFVQCGGDPADQVVKVEFP